MRRFDQEFLSTLLDAYEESKLYRGENQVSVSISEKITKEKYPFYFDDRDDAYLDMHQQLFSLEEKGLIALSWRDGKRGHHLEKVSLVFPAEPAYRYLGRKEKKSKEQVLLEVISSFLSEQAGEEGEKERKTIGTGKTAILDSFLLWLQERIQKGESVKKYVELDHPEELRCLCTLIKGILENAEECYVREISIRLFQNSKVAEKEIMKAARIISVFGDDSLRELSPEEILMEYGVVKTPSWILLKGRGCVCREGGESRIYLEDFPGGLGISQEEAPLLSWDTRCAPSFLITIENLTSFHRFRGLSLPEGYLAIYLGGYAAPVQREFIKHLGATFPELPRYHFGDMDCGGFLIWKTLVQGTGLSFTPYRMDRETYLASLPLGQDLSKAEKEKLSRMAKDPFFSGQKELFALLVEKGRKIEQECILA